MMNILEKEDLIKGLPDNVLQQQMQNPTGELPQYLLISEIQRRTDMRKSLQEQPQQESIADQIRMEGIMATRPQMPPQMQPPMGMEQPPMPMEQPPMGMAQGGVVRMRNLGKVPSRSFELAKKAFQAGATVRDVASLLRMSVNDVMSTFGSIIPETALSPPEEYTESQEMVNVPYGQEFAQPALDFLRPDLSGVEIPSPFDVSRSVKGAAGDYLRNVASMEEAKGYEAAMSAPDRDARIAAMQSAPPANNFMNNEFQMASIDELMNNSGINALGGIADKAREDLIRQRVQEYRPSSAGARSFNAFDPEDIPSIEVPATEKGILTNGMPVFQETSIQDDGIRSLIESPGRLLSEAEMPEGRGVVTEASDERKSDKLDANRNIFERIPSIMEGIRSFDPSRLFPRTDKGYVYDVYDRKTDPVGDFYKDIASKNQPNPLYSTLGLPLAQEVVEGPGNLMMGEFNTIYQPSGFQEAGSEAQVTGVDDEAVQSEPLVTKVVDDAEVVVKGADTTGGIPDVLGAGTTKRGAAKDSYEELINTDIAELREIIGSKTDPIDLSDIIESSRRDARGQALVELGAGIAAGDLAGGLQRAGKAASEVEKDRKKLMIQERVAQSEALEKDRQRKITGLTGIANIRSNMRKMEADLAESGRVRESTAVRAAIDAAESILAKMPLLTSEKEAEDMFLRVFRQYYQMAGGSGETALGSTTGAALAGANNLQALKDKGFSLSPAGQN